MITLNAVYFGPQEEGEPYLAPFKALGPVRSNISMVPGNEIMDAAFFNFFGNDNGACLPNQHINIYTIALRQIDSEKLELFFTNLTNFWIANPNFQGRLLLQRYSNQAVQAVPDDETAYAFRDTKTYMWVLNNLSRLYHLLTDDLIGTSKDFIRIEVLTML